MPKKDNHNRPERILASAAQLIAYHGYDKVTVSDIAAQAGVSKGAIYLHWSSKDELLGALLIYEMKRLVDDVLQRVEADPDGGDIARIYLHALLALKGNPLMRALYTRDNRVLGDYMRRQDPDRYTQRVLFGREFVEEMQAAGLIRADMRAEVIAYLMAVISFGFTSIGGVISDQSAPPLEEIGAALSDVIQRGFAQPGGDRQAGKRALARLSESVHRQYEMIAAAGPQVRKQEGSS